MVCLDASIYPQPHLRVLRLFFSDSCCSSWQALWSWNLISVIMGSEYEDQEKEYTQGFCVGCCGTWVAAGFFYVHMVQEKN